MNDFGGRNDDALSMVSESLLPQDSFLLRAKEDTGEIVVHLNCSDVFAWGCADCEELPDEYWDEFEKSIDLARSKFGWRAPWFSEAWSVKLRGIAPQKPATDRHPEFVDMLDFLGVNWLEMKRYDELPTPTEGEPTE